MSQNLLRCSPADHLILRFPDAPREFSVAFAAQHADLSPEATPPIPAHWKFDHGPSLISSVARVVTQILCLVSLGHSNLETVWKICCDGASEEIWINNKDRLATRISSVTIIAGLLLSTYAALVTTEPPVKEILNYTRHGTYICLFLSLGITLGGLIVGSAMLFVITKCPKEWFRDTLMGNKPSVICTMILVSYPFFSIGAATIIGALALVVAAGKSQLALVRAGAPLLIVLPALMIPLFIYTQVWGWFDKKIENSKLFAHREKRDPENAQPGPSGAGST